MGMMWHLGKIHIHPDLTPCCIQIFGIAYQIWGRNFFQVGDDVTIRACKVFPRHVTHFAKGFHNSFAL
ncbi:hypothetical protein Hanom_Chr12g01140871 [Helianthus anomalus]